MEPDPPITALLRDVTDGDAEALNSVVEHLYGELRAISGRIMSKERANHTLQPTALVNEVYLRLLRLKRLRCDDRAKFLGYSARIMRRILVDYARTRSAEKRGGKVRRVDVDLSILADSGERSVDLIDLDRALTKLDEIDPALVALIELRFFAGLTEVEAAEILGKKRDKVQKEWVVAKRWLVSELNGSGSTS